MPPRLSIPLCIVLGLIMAVAVAWACVLISPARHPISFSMQRDAGGYGVILRVASLRSFGFERTTTCVIRQRTEPETDVILMDTEADQVIRAGWPFAALQCENDAGLDIAVGESDRLRSWNGQRQLRGGWPLPPVADALGAKVWRALPLRPVWPGFALNWLIFAGGSFCVLGLPTLVRRVRRRARGECIRCGYDLRGGGESPARCPECGAKVRG